MKARLVHRRLLDPRPADEAARHPVAEAVNIPLAELPHRAHELPPRDRALGVVGPEPLVREAVDWLTQVGRRAHAANTPQPCRAPCAAEIGRLWEPNPFLAELLPRLAPARVLELACGTGRDAVFMASHGWSVTAVDVLPDALALGRKLAERYPVASEAIEWLEIDLEAAPPRFERVFDLIVVIRYLHRPLFARLHEWIQPEGSIVYETFTTTHRQRYGRPARDAHVLAPDELPGLLAGFEIRHHSEQWRGRAHTARVWAVRPAGA
jgi:SAM-dependent methyltransferase